MNSTHAAKIARIAAQLAARPAGAKVTIRKATPSHSIRDPGYKARCHPVDVSALTEILAIDVERRTARVEGQVTIGELSRAVLAHGLLPAVVPEFRQFTIAGLLSGEGIQSSSHRYGVFSHTVEAVELLVADGTTVEIVRDVDDDLILALRESLGTLGLVTAATIRLVPARRFVRLTTRRFARGDEYVRAFTSELAAHDFHEGVVFGPERYVLVTGDFTDDPASLPPWRPDADGEPYFYQRVRDAAIARDVTESVVETLAYLSRSERGLWWMVECHVDWPMLTETAWGRRRIDTAVSEGYARQGLRSDDHARLQHDRCVINQDMGVTLARLGDAIAWVQDHLAVYPLWNCAVRLPDGEYVVDVGIYGEPMATDYRYVRDMRALQRMADAPSLWGVSYLSWDEICSVDPQRFDAYERARQRLRAGEAFLHLKDKVVWIDSDQSGDGKIPNWRLYRSFGPRWFFNPAAYLVGALALGSRAIWRRPA